MLGSRVRTDFLTLLLSQAIKVNIFSRPSFSQKVLTILFVSILKFVFSSCQSKDFSPRRNISLFRSFDYAQDDGSRRHFKVV